MDNQTAFVQVRSMLTHLRAFQHVEAVLEVAIAAEGHAAELQRELKDLNERIKAASSRVTVSETAAEQSKHHTKRALEEDHLAIKATQEDAKTYIERLKNEAEEAARAIGESLTAAQQIHDAETARMQEEVEALSRQKKTLEDALDGLKSRIDKA